MSDTSKLKHEAHSEGGTVGGGTSKQNFIESNDQ